MDKVLIVSHDLSMQTEIKRMVMTRFDVLTADSGETGLRLLHDFRHVQAVICDTRAVDMTGPEFLRRIGEAFSDLILIQLVDPEGTAAARPNDLAHPTWRRIQKPVDPQKLLSLLENKSGSGTIPPAGEGEAVSSGAIKRALDKTDPDREFSMLYQPRICTTTEQTCCVEALLRWRQPEFGMISPARFIPLAEETGEIIWITDWTLIAACRALRTWLDHGDDPVPVSVNISPKAYCDPRVVALVANALRAARVPAHLLRLEVTRPIDFTANAKACATTETLKHMKVAVSFKGSLESVSADMDTPWPYHNCLRTGQALIGNLTDGDPVTLFRSIRAVASKLGIRTVAAGVETQQHLEFIRRIGFDQMQGFLISRPLSQSELPAWLKLCTSP